MTKIGCLIIEDEPNAQQLLQDYISKVPYLTLKGTCFDALEALELLGHSQADLIFLDINMPDLTGIELIHMLPKEQKVIFTTASSDHAIESYEYNAVDYLLKPITFKRFLMAVQKAFNPASPPPSQAEEYLFAKSDKKMIRVNLRDIVYFEALKEYVCIHTRTQKIVTYKRMKELLEKLPGHFTRIHNSYIVNGDHITRVEGNYVLVGDKNLPIGISYRDAFAGFIQLRAL
ncbi:response regulator transcription factor [Flavitalea sp. BT771]|uniref:LytR/AlgR family response regulator transcription factor n=1 Tax=Flavitalea sp. BT771 TaxID=3063329 RepID=UPI0026E3DB84|nr:response regulator transcription factor [Flavitalea sp. BT771]MDO6430738.1 response regulator transcription factor [Flavitalea sp. BT771]MDV6219122.1 response regulator transcription factor [Flavitalea sp. BT771]